jgi:hypothetical protein
MQVKNSALLLLGIAAMARADFERNPISLGTNWDMGQLVQGKLNKSDGKELRVENQFLTRTGIYLTESGSYNKRLDIAVTVGALFWTPLPEAEHWMNRTVQMGIAIGQAQGLYKFGNPEDPAATLQFGIFPIKYNPDARDLGEYLYRSGTYPGVVYTGGWSYLNSAAYMAQGLRFTMPHWGGKFTHSLTFTMERDFQRNKDFTPGYLFTLKPADFFEFGGGLVWTHGVPLGGDSSLTPIKCKNAYFKATGKPVTAAEADAGACHDNERSDSLGYYTFQGFKVAARAAFNFGTLLGMGPDDFKLYGEWALLGIKDYPFYYEKKSERMPVMAGLNIPTFKLLDILGVEVEYRKSRFRNTMFWVMDDAPLPIPLANTSEVQDPTVYDPANPKYTPAQADSLEKAFARDDWHWSVYARRQITKGMTVHAQVASDHLRHFGLQIAPIPGYAPATERTKDWYYILRLEFGI